MGSGWKTFISKGLKIDIQLHHREVTKIIPLCTLVTRSEFRSLAHQCPDFNEMREKDQFSVKKAVFD